MRFCDAFLATFVKGCAESGVLLPLVVYHLCLVGLKKGRQPPGGVQCS